MSSFSQRVKEELCGKIPQARHCQLAELAGMTHFGGQLGQVDPEHYLLGFQTEKEAVVRKGFTLLKKTFNIDSGAWLTEPEMQDFLGKIGNFEDPVSQILVKSSCCQRAYLRGAFLGAGSMTDPQKGYHLEITGDAGGKAEQLMEMMRGFGIGSKLTMRGQTYVVYLKEGEAIADMLSAMEATVSLMELENTLIFREVNNSVNRRVNCELSNIRKTVAAASRQVEAITKIRDLVGLDSLPENLREMAVVRLEHPEVSLEELGKYLDPPVGKSGVNHRLRKLVEYAEKL